MTEDCNVNALLGKTLVGIDREDDHELIFKTSEGETFRMYHEQDCCEIVYLQDIEGDLEDLVGSEILLAEEVSGNTPAGFKFEADYDSCTWTFYKFATNKGHVTLRWLGQSNGYYSESVTFEKVKKKTIKRL
jgi:hypothetical protein